MYTVLQTVFFQNHDFLRSIKICSIVGILWWPSLFLFWKHIDSFQTPSIIVRHGKFKHAHLYMKVTCSMDLEAFCTLGGSSWCNAMTAEKNKSSFIHSTCQMSIRLWWFGNYFVSSLTHCKCRFDFETWPVSSFNRNVFVSRVVWAWVKLRCVTWSNVIYCSFA